MSKIDALLDFLCDDEISDEWLDGHVSFEFEKSTKTVKIIIDNMNEQEFKWLSDAI